MLTIITHFVDKTINLKLPRNYHKEGISANDAVHRPTQ